MKYLILGAGPAGLAFANRLLEAGETSFLVLEKEAEAGGLCRSVMVDGSPLDIGGGHFLDVRRPKVNEFLFRFMPVEEWKLFTRDSRIVIKDNIVSHPLEANIWQMKKEDQIDYLKSIAIAGCNLGSPVPERFVEWIYWKFGERIAEDYLLPYNRKVYSDNLNELGTYWLDKLPNVSFDDTLMSCLDKKAYGTQPGHASFYYPIKYGYGELWLRMADALKDRIEYRVDISSIDFDSNTVNGVYSAETIINTIPWTAFSLIKGMPGQLRDSIGKLKNNSLQIGYVSEKIASPAHWIYYPDPKLSYHRILIRHNFCTGSKGYWTETNSERVSDISKAYHYMNKFAYPLNTIEKPEIMKELLGWAKTRKVYGLGRWGEWQHYNSDAVVELAMKLADELTK
jgi:protoporphyrinogen oxidase